MPNVALVLVGSRTVNKRACRFIESLRGSGFDPVVAVVPRRPWGTSGMEDPALVARQGRVTLRGADSDAGRSGRPRLIVCMHWSILPVALLLKCVLRVPVVYDEHDHYEMLAFEATGPAWMIRARSRWIRRVHAWCLPFVDVVTCIHLVGGRLRQHLESRAKTVIELHNYPSPRWGRPGGGGARSDGSIAIVYSGGIWDVKGCDIMLDAFLLLADDHSLPPVTLHIFGRGDPAIERRLATSAGVTFHGETVADDIIGFLVGHECIGLVLLDDTPRYSLVSTNCHKLYEYMAAGAPVVATDVGEIKDIVTDLDGGWVIEAGFDAETLATMIRTILADPRELRRRGDAAAAAIRHNRLWWDDEWRKLEALDVLRPTPREAARRAV